MKAKHFTATMSFGSAYGLPQGSILPRSEGYKAFRLGPAPHPLRVYNRGHIQGSLYNYIINIIHLSMRGGSVQRAFKHFWESCKAI